MLEVDVGRFVGRLQSLGLVGKIIALGQDPDETAEAHAMIVSSLESSVRRSAPMCNVKAEVRATLVTGKVTFVIITTMHDGSGVGVYRFLVHGDNETVSRVGTSVRGNGPSTSCVEAAVVDALKE